jgi:hypothetical protein
MEFFDTHPDTGRRIQAIEEDARTRGWSTDGPKTPLPEWLKAAMHASAPDGEGT